MRYLIYKSALIIAFSFLTSCSKEVTKEDLKNLNGYWEIEKVTTKSQTKEYTINTTVDFYQIDRNGDGHKLKLKPNFTGTYTTNAVKDTVHIKHRNDSIFLVTSSPFNKWEALILELNENTLILKNEEGNIYQYKKHLKFDL